MTATGRPPGPKLETERLILRPPSIDDLDAFAAFGADAVTMRFLGGPEPRSGAWRALALYAGMWALHGFGMFSVVERSTGRWIGRIGPWRPEGWPGSEVGWGLVRSATGRGYAYEAAVAAIDWSVDSLGWTDVIHVIDHDNAPSIALASRLGAVCRGPGRLPPPFHEAHVDLWGQSAADWRARRSTSP